MKESQGQTLGQCYWCQGEGWFLQSEAPGERVCPGCAQAPERIAGIIRGLTPRQQRKAAVRLARIAGTLFAEDHHDSRVIEAVDLLLMYQESTAAEEAAEREVLLARVRLLLQVTTLAWGRRAAFDVIQAATLDDGQAALECAKCLPEAAQESKTRAFAGGNGAGSWAKGSSEAHRAAKVTMWRSIETTLASLQRGW